MNEHLPHPTHLGKAISTEAGQSHEVHIRNIIAPFLQVLAQTSKGSSL
jgi:hypothetical protein